jgi:hypothetical protein
MALAAADFSQTKTTFLGPGRRMVTGIYTGPASYANGGEILTHAIALRATGLKEIHSLVFTPLVDHDSGVAPIIGVAFDHARTSTTHGKIRAFNATRAHTHDLSIIGGQAAAATDTVFCPAATDLLGKQEAGDALVLGADVATKGGVVSSAVQLAQTEAGAAANLSAFVARFTAMGV